MSKDDKVFSIGQVAEQTGVAASAIRYYEAEGLLPRAKREGDKRRYGPDIVRRLRVIRLAQNAGLPLSEIRVLMAGVGGNKRAAAALTRMAKTKLPEIEAGLKRLKALKKMFGATADGHCPDLKSWAAIANKAETRHDK